MSFVLIRKKGITVLLVMIITFIISLLSLGCWYKSSLLFDLVLQRESYYKNFYLTESILNYGIFFTKNNFNRLLISKEQEKILTNLDVSFLLKSFSDNFNNNCFLDKSAELLISKVQSEDEFLISAFLKNKKNNKIVFKLSCLLSKNKINNVYSYFVKNFTIGNFI